MRRDSVKAPSKKRRRERQRSRPARPPRSHPVSESDALRTAEASESSCLPESSRKRSSTDFAEECCEPEEVSAASAASQPATRARRRATPRRMRRKLSVNVAGFRVSV